MPIFSRYHDDADMAEIIAMFVAELPDRVQAMDEALQHGEYGKVQRLAHQIKGAGGGYGFDQLSESAARLEAAATSADRGQTIDALNSFRSITSDCQAGGPT